jgi:hypothetical protein
MRETRFIKYYMSRFVNLILILILLMLVSCSDRKNDAGKKDLIPEKELISLLTDIHLADGLLALPKIYDMYSSLDSITAYSHVIEKHGYTKELLDKTMKYYFINDPKNLNRIYDQVLGILSEMESQVESESMTETAHLLNQWPGKDFYAFPARSGNDSTMFDVTLVRPGVYTLTYTATLFPDDQSVNARSTVYSCSADSLLTGKRKYVKTLDFLKDGRPHIYKLNFSVPQSKTHHLRGWLFDFDNRPFDFEKHIKIENISISFSPFVVS